MFFFASVLAALLVAPPAAQDPDESRYYDFWPGTWCELVDDRPNPDGSRFIVTQGVHASAYDEEWQQVIDGRRLISSATRAWDPVERRWMLVWIGAEGHFQIWAGEKADADWYIQRPFEQGGRRFLSRQAWIPTAPDRLVRVMERSFDNGATWEPRYRTAFGRCEAG